MQPSIWRHGNLRLSALLAVFAWLAALATAPARAANVKPDGLTLIPAALGAPKLTSVWSEEKDTAAIGGRRMTAAPASLSYNTQQPNKLLQYKLNFSAAGTYYVDVLARVAAFGTTQPFTLGLNGQALPGGNTDYDFGSRWGDGMASIVIGAPGAYTLDIWAAQLGVSIDGISLSPSPFVRGPMPRAVATQAMLDSIAVDVHLENSPGPYTDLPGVIASLQWLNCTSVRFAFVNAQSLSQAQTLAEHGIKLDVLIRSEAESAYTVDEQLALAARVAPDVISLEGLNEPDVEGAQYGSLTGIPAVVAVTKRIKSFVLSTPSLRQVATITPSIGGYDPNTLTQLGNLARFVTNANAHVYPAGVAPPFWALDPSLQFLSGMAPGRPTMMTEFGYNSMVGQGGVDETVQAKDILDGLLDAFRVGVQRTFIYELYNNLPSLTGGGTTEDYYGLFNADATPRMASNAIHNFTRILDDPNAGGFTPKSLQYTVTGLPWNAWQILMAKSDGSYVLALWSESQIWNGSSEISVPPAAITVTLRHAARSATVFDPLTGTSPIASYSRVKSIQVSLTDHPLLLEIKP